MRVVAARFPASREAWAVRDLLERQMDLDPPDVSIAPLATAGEESPDETVLAGRFPDEQAQAVIELVRRAGGEIVADLDERFTRPSQWPASGPSGSHGAFGAQNGWRMHA